MGQYVLRTAGSCFEYRKFEWPKYDDRRVVHSSHVLSMVDAHPGGLSEGWHELHEGISPPAPLGRLLMSPASVPFHTRGYGGRLMIARLQLEAAQDDFDGLIRERDARRLHDCLDLKCPNIASGMRRLVREALPPGFASDILLDTVSATIRLDIWRYLKRLSHNTFVAQRLSRRELDKILEYVDANLARRITVNDIASLIDVSERHLSWLFRAGTGTTVHRFIELRRFENAKSLLDESTYPHKKIAHLLGFSSRVGFSLAFQRLAGQSSQEYRQNARARTP